MVKELSLLMNVQSPLRMESWEPDNLICRLNSPVRITATTGGSFHRENIRLARAVLSEET